MLCLFPLSTVHDLEPTGTHTCRFMNTHQRRCRRRHMVQNFFLIDRHRRRRRRGRIKERLAHNYDMPPSGLRDFVNKDPQCVGFMNIRPP